MFIIVIAVGRNLILSEQTIMEFTRSEGSDHIRSSFTQPSNDVTLMMSIVERIEGTALNLPIVGIIVVTGRSRLQDTGPLALSLLLLASTS